MPVYRDVIVPLADIVTPNQFEIEYVLPVCLLMPVYRDVIVPLADIVTPNQFEIE